MKLKNIDDVKSFLTAVDQCENDVWLKSIYGDNYNLKSKLCQYIAVAALLGKHGEELELFASNKKDEAILLNYLTNHPEVIR